MQRRFLQLQDFLGFCTVNYPHLVLQTEPILIGVSRRETNVRPAAFFYMRCNIDSSAITELYARAQDGYESTKIYAVSVKDLRDMSQRLPGCHLGGFALYELMRNASESL
uniref:Uncharacterized protein n=2 Tax=Aegilops tauschii subsp. strangulata TaxID=200361 RepID=A0A452XQB2_AEGTS